MTGIEFWESPEKEELEKQVAREKKHNKAFDEYATWNDYHKALTDEGLTDDQIKEELKGTRWDTEGKKYQEWRDAPLIKRDMNMPEDNTDYAPVNSDVPQQEGDDVALTNLSVQDNQPTEIDSEARKKELRSLYANDNKGYNDALKREGIENDVTNNPQSIQQAYYSGKIDKNTRDYMMANAIATFARNTGKDIGNIGAQYTGGTVDSNYETSEWDKRNTALAGNQTTAEMAKQEGSKEQRAATSENLANEKSSKALSAARLMSDYKNRAYKMAEDFKKNGNNKAAAIMQGVAGEYALLESGSTSGVDKEEHIGNIAAALAEAVAAGYITKDDMNEQLANIKGKVSPSININANLGGGLGGSPNIGKDGEEMGFFAADSTFKNNSEKQAAIKDLGLKGVSYDSSPEEIQVEILNKYGGTSELDLANRMMEMSQGELNELSREWGADNGILGSARIFQKARKIAMLLGASVGYERYITKKDLQR